MSYTKNEIALETFVSNVNSFFYYVGEDDDLIPFPRYEIRERLDKYVSQFMKSIDYQDSEILNEWDDLIDVHNLLEEINVN